MPGPLSCLCVPPSAHSANGSGRGTGFRKADTGPMRWSQRSERYDNVSRVLQRSLGEWRASRCPGVYRMMMRGPAERFARSQLDPLDVLHLPKLAQIIDVGSYAQHCP